MTSISKFGTALLSVPNELTVAAANFNLNFSLMKVEAPPEFHGLRDVLSHRRRHEAEEGIQHITARCLGALFESLIPSIPCLTAAYGKRVSEISKQLSPVSLPAGMFADRVGADGTSIWAAATSGQHAIAMHLLACMLARIWKPAEATSLWVELVERRKQEIFKAYNSSSAAHIPSIMAAQQLFTRDQLSAWDASARSWLQAADAAKRLEQTQLMLIINNVRKPVNMSQEPYESVVTAWTSGMDAMERLIVGTPQRVQDGAILVAITAWHLYPNMQVLSDCAKDISPGDELMIHSLLTVSSFDLSGGREGVFWSLPLSRMRYYSAPVITERSLASDTSRISIEEFQIVFLGAFVARWKRICSDEERCCRLIIRLQHVYKTLRTTVPPWFNILADAAARVIKSSGSIQAQNRKLLRLGSRRCTGFLYSPEHELPIMFGLEYFHVLIRCTTEPEQRIKILREASETRSKGKNQGLLLRYKKSPSHRYHYATVTPSTRTSHKRRLGQAAKSSTGHQRFALGYFEEKETIISCHGPLGCGCTDPAMGECICKQSSTDCTTGCHEDTDVCRNVSGRFSLSYDCQKGCSDERPCVGCINEARLSELAAEGEEALLIHPEKLEDVDDFQFLIETPGKSFRETHMLWLGHGQTAAVFRRQDGPTYDTYSQSVSDMPSATIEEIEAVVYADGFNPASLELWSSCYHASGEGLVQQMRSLSALMFTTSLYQSMPDSTVSIEVINGTLYGTSWVRSLELIELEYPYSYSQGLWWHYDETINRVRARTSQSRNLQSLRRWSNKELKPDIHAYPFHPDHLHEDTVDLFPFHENALHEGAIIEVEPQVATLAEDIPEEDGWYFAIRSPPTSQQRLEQEMHTLEQVFHHDHEKAQNDKGFEMRRIFSCIAWFESGEFDIEMEHLQAVMALANGASIYVASGLLGDPSATTKDAPVRRVFGNLGRSELCLLVPPADPRLAKPDVRSWKLINHSAFDGQFQDCFGGTTLHLTFTDSEDAVYVGNRGLRDRQVVLLETLISIDDRGRNIGDLDILSMFDNPRLRVNDVCAHASDKDITSVTDWDLTAVDCWEEFLDPPTGTGIFRASGNWQARLGATAAAIQAGKNVLVLPKPACLLCLGKSVTGTVDIVIA
jgi:hypothetical protein